MFCFKCGEVTENENCRRCETENKQTDNYWNYYDEEVILMRIPVTNTLNRLMMISVFSKGDQRRNYKGYDYILRPNEFAKDSSKPMHIHVLGEKGSMKVNLNSVERDTSQPTNIPPSLERKLIKHIADNITDIKQRIKEELEKRNIKVPPF